MEAFRSRFEYIQCFFTVDGDLIPWFNHGAIPARERQFRKGFSGDSDGHQETMIKNLSRALIHSKEEEDIKREIDMIEISSRNYRRVLQQTDKLYILVVGYYRMNDYAKSRQLVQECLQVAHNWRMALSFQKTIEEQIVKDSVIGIGITAIAVGLVVGVIASKVLQHWPASASRLAKIIIL